MAQDSGLQIVDEDDGWSTTKKFEGVLVAGQEVFQGFPAGELDIDHAAVTEDHDEKGEPAARGTQRDRARASPINLGCFTRRKGQAQERRMAHRAHHSHVVF